MQFRKIMTVILFALFGAQFSTIANADAPQNKQEIGVILLGDQGKNNEGQKIVAAAMTRFCMKEQCDAVVLLGDNIYSSGVRSVRDRKFETHFENHYRDLKVPFWAVLGNHDYGYGLSRGNVQAQIDYSTRSTKWRMPARYYSFTIGRLEFIAIDTVALPKDKAQLEWLTQLLNTQKLAHRIVVGHYPIHSSGMHGDNAFMRDNVAPILCGRADIYAAGHDHHLEHTVTDCGVVQIVSGAGAETRPVKQQPRTLFASASLGFTYLRMMSSGELSVEYFNENLDSLAQFKKPTP
jgi:acid phosphatase